MDVGSEYAHAAMMRREAVEESENGDGNAHEEASGEGDESLEREWAATEIQRAWKLHQYHQQQEHQQQQQSTTHEKRTPNTSADEAPRKRGVCCSCFGLIETRSEQATATSAAVNQEDDDQVFCTACLFAMATTSSPASHPFAIASSLPKLSLLVQAEAKYQYQLQLLRSQQDFLRKQQEEMQARKHAQAKQHAAERELARERNRQFQLAMAKKKREEELKFQQFAAASPEEGDEEDHEGVTTPQSKPKKKRMKEIIPLRRAALLRSIDAACNPCSPSPLTLPGLERRSATGLGSSPMQESTSQEQRRKQTHRRMVGCYAQDLTPLINGQKPKRIPLPSPSPAPESSSRTDQNSASKKKSHKAQSQHPSQDRSTPKTNTPKKKTRHPAKLRPIEKSALTSSNQHEEFERGWDYVNAKPTPNSSFSTLSSPLTAEIKPISWIYELGKDVLGDELPSGGVSSTTPAPPPLQHDSQSYSRLAQLTSVQEEQDTVDATSLLQPRQASFDLHLQHQLPSKTILSSSSSSYTIAATPSAAPTTSMSSSTQQQWEYSTDRLASLLVKYNVSVSSNK